MKNLCFAFLLLAIFSCNQQNDNLPRPIQMLFLGHSSEHHNSSQVMPVLAQSLINSGIHLTYSEDPEVLNDKDLALYDGIILYANHDSITASQEKSLLDFVASGKAFLPIHSASYCFRNSEAFIELVGGQFNSHDTAIFSAEIITAEHPVINGLTTFETWDETYVHHKLSEDKVVLMERVEGEHREPWTWVRNHGKGRVFYTAYGHDIRTWSNPGFHALIKNGIVWAVGDRVKGLWESFSKDIPQLQYEEVANIPNYEKRDPAPKFQQPLSPEQSAKLIQVPPGFELRLFASEPDIINPIAMNWDEKGRLWVIETIDYPNTVREEDGTGDDKIKILEDTDGDGKADKVTVFAENLNIPTSFVFANGGVIVSQAPYFVFLKDTNGDDVADVRENIIEGWGTFDTHAGPSNLQNGIDNRIYGVLGYSGFKGQIFGDSMEFRQGIYSFDREYKNFEFLSNTTNNTWGLGITEDNHVFASTANNTHSVYLGIPNRYFENVEGLKFRGSQKIDGHYEMLALTPNVRQVDVFGGYTAAAGHHFYTANTYPERYWNKVAFVCEPTGGVVHIAKIEKEGAGYVEVDGGNLFASSDEWVSPVEARTGPDGNVWVLDWYNFIVQHNPTPTVERGGYEAENGAGNAYVNPLRDRSKGRIWRVVPKGFPVKLPTRELSASDPSKLVKSLSDPNMFWRMTAQRILVESKLKDQAKDLIKLVNKGNLHALWTLDGLGLVESKDKETITALKAGLFQEDPSIRRAAIQILEKYGLEEKAVFASGALQDEDPTVQLAGLLYFSQIKSSENPGKLLYDFSQDSAIIKDYWRSHAVYMAASQQPNAFIGAYLNANPDFNLFAGEMQDTNSLAELFVRTYIQKMEKTEVEETSTSVGKPQIIRIGTIENEMKYDLTEFQVESGKPVEIVFSNTDFMQHNFVLVKKGAKEKVGAAADKMASAKDGPEKHYVPEMEEVLYFTKMVNPQEKVVLRFIAPEEPGNYPYLCTFPGHWRIMQGTMKVVKS